MGPFTLTGLVVAGSIIAGVTVDIGVNTLQNWFDVFYADAFWSQRQASSPALEALTREEAEIDRLMQAQDFPVAKPAQ